MAESLRESLPVDDWRAALTQTIDQQRRRLGERIASQRERLRELEARVASQIDGVTCNLAQIQEQTGQAAVRADANAAAVDRRQDELDQRQLEFERRLAEAEQIRLDLARQSAATERQAAELAKREAESAANVQEQHLEQTRLAAERDAVAQFQADFALKQQALAERERRTVRQRRQVAQQLRAKQKELLAEIDLQRAQSLATGAGQELQLQLQLSELQGKCDRLREELESRDQERDRATEHLGELRAQLDLRQHEVRQQQGALAQAERRQTELETERQRLAADLQRHLEQTRHQAEAARADLARTAGETRGQALEIARLNAELDRVRRETHEQIERERASQGQSHDARVQSLQDQLDELRARRAAEQSSWDSARRQLQADLAAAQHSADSKAAADLAKLREENKQLETWLREAEAKAQGQSPLGEQEIDDLRRRFEMAVQDVRELKQKNAELSEQLAKAHKIAGGATGAAVISGGGPQGWESLKQKLLAEMETDFDAENAAQRADKLTVEGAIKITDQVVADKEQEIQELKRLLETQSQQVGDVVVGAAAFAQVLDADEVVRQERTNLQQLQEGLREQLRKAEIDISVERAKLARERAEIEEKQRGLEAERANYLPSEGPGDKTKRPAGRKWLARLGLGEEGTSS